MMHRLIMWLCRGLVAQPVVTFAGDRLFDRYEFFRKDEWPDSWWDKARDEYPVRPRSLPWCLPFNMFLHQWVMRGETPESYHDHPRWSVTVCLSGTIVEKTPWETRTLTPGSVVFRSRKSIHAFQVPDQQSDVWTLFIVGRRRHRQNNYEITPR